MVITCFTDEHWRALVSEMGSPAWAARAEFATVEDRFERQDELDPLVETWTSGQDRYDVMRRLQAAGVPAAVCQNTADRYERDPQLRHRGLLRPRTPLGSAAVRHGGASGALLGHAALAVGTVG